MSTVKDRVKAAAQHEHESTAWGQILGVGLLLVTVVFVPSWGEPFTIPKVTAATALALVALPLLWLRRRQLLGQPWPLILAGAFLVLSVLSLLFSGAPLLGSLWGDWGRRAGTLFVFALVVIFAAASVLTRREIRAALAWLAWAGVPACVYGLLQLVGVDPFPWTDQGWVVSTFGNPNFAAAGLSMLALMTAGLAVAGDFSTIWRVLMAPLAAVEALLALSTGSSLALFALASGALLGALAWVLRSPWPRRSLVAGVLLGVAVLGAALSAWGLLGSGPLAAAVSPDTLQFRRWYWGAGLHMVSTHPLLGVGPDGYGRFYGSSRSEEAAQMFTDGANHAHDVPLQWASTLGTPAAFVYVALVVVVAIVILRRLWRDGAQVSPLTVPLLAAWGAYQVQSLVSIDEIGVSVMGWFMMGALLAVTLRPSAVTRVPTPAAAWVAAGVLGLVGALVWLPPLLASNASRTVVQGTTEADVQQAIALLEAGTLPCRGAVPVAQWLTTVAPSEATVDAVYTYVANDDRCYAMVNAAADFAIQLGEANRAVPLAEQAVAIDPLNYSPWLLVARAQHLAGDTVAAQQALDRAAALAPGNADVATTADDLNLPVPVPPPA